MAVSWIIVPSVQDARPNSAGRMAAVAAVCAAALTTWSRQSRKGYAQPAIGTRNGSPLRNLILFVRLKRETSRVAFDLLFSGAQPIARSQC